MCESKDIPYWEILLGKTSVIMVDTELLSDVEFKRFNYGRYSEVYTSSYIPNSCISVVRLFVDRISTMAELCEDYAFSVSDLVAFMTRFATHPTDSEDYRNRIINSVSGYVNVINNRLDYSYLSDDYIKYKMIKYGESGEYTMCDEYCVDRNEKSHVKLYEQLSRYDFGNHLLKPLNDSYIELQRCILKYYPWVCSIQTGGYTG